MAENLKFDIRTLLTTLPLSPVADKPAAEFIYHTPQQHSRSYHLSRPHYDITPQTPAMTSPLRSLGIRKLVDNSAVSGRSKKLNEGSIEKSQDSHHRREGVS
jgi:hypothetical protein